MVVDAIEQEFQRKVCAQVRLAPEGVNRFRVFTPFMFDDGDHLAIVLKRARGRWILSDEAHTFMRLTYQVSEKDMGRGNRAKIISNALDAFAVENRDGELMLDVPEERYGDALYSFVQALLKISDLSYLNREQVRSTFMQDFRSFIDDQVPEDRRTFDWHDPRNDPDAKYPVDCRVNGMERPLFIYALPSNTRVRDATISLHEFEKWNLPFHSLGIYEDVETINRKVAARFMDICERQFSSLAGNTPRIKRYLSNSIR